MVDPNGNLTRMDIQGLESDLTELKIALREMTKAMTQVAVIDAKLYSQQQAIERAFESVAKLGDAMEKHIIRQDQFRHEREQIEREKERQLADQLAKKDREDDIQFADFKKTINRASGALAVVYVLSGGFTTYAISVISDLVSNSHQAATTILQVQQEVKAHEKDDRLQSEDDLRKMLPNILPAK
jgi:cyanate lyase